MTKKKQQMELDKEKEEKTKWERKEMLGVHGINQNEATKAEKEQKRKSLCGAALA